MNAILSTLAALAISNLAADAPPVRFVPAGEAWSATSVNTVVFRSSSLASLGDIQFISYYDCDGHLVLGRRDISKDARFETVRTRFRGNVRDAHNSISMAVDGAGYLHISFDHHNAPLKYVRSTAPLSLELGEIEHMTGKGESRVTYPEFHRLADGSLIFAFRDGASGSGNLVLNRYDLATRTWSRIHDSLIDGEGRQSPYWQMCTDSTGAIHISWTWRESPDVATNHDILYAVSRDGGATWQKSDGTSYSLPITEATAERAAAIPRRSELINQTGMTADDNSRPLIATYFRLPGDKAVQYRIVRHDGASWRVDTLGERTLDFRLSGGGTKKIPVSRPRIVSDGRGAIVLFRDEERGSKASCHFCRNLAKGEWETYDLTENSLGEWEPSIDEDLWRERRILHIFIQSVRQGDAEGVVPGAPTMAGALEVKTPGSHVVHGPRTLKGTVIDAKRGDIHFFMVADDGLFWRVSMGLGQQTPQTGDRVEVSGRVEPWTVNNRLDWGKVRVVSHDASGAPPCIDAAIADLRRHPSSGDDVPDLFAHRVRTRGIVEDIVRRQDETQLVLADAGKRVFVNLRLGVADKMPEDLRLGANVEVAGIFSYVTLPYESDGFAFTGITEPTIICPGPHMLRIVDKTPFWTPLRIWSTLAVLFSVIMAGGIAIFLMRRTIARQTQIIHETVARRVADDAVRRERLRLSHDLHDEFQQFLTGAALHVRAAENWLGEDENQARVQLAEARSVINHMQSDLRMVLWDLHGESEGPGGVEGVFRYLVSRLPGWAGVVHFSSSGKERFLARSLSSAVLMILQEAVGNATRHSKATRVDVSVAFAADALTLAIDDNGTGFDTSKPIPPGHFGLESMRERTKALGGTFRLVSTIGKGVSIHIFVPFPH